jgi:hypothetical protein
MFCGRIRRAPRKPDVRESNPIRGWESDDARGATSPNTGSSR